MIIASGPRVILRDGVVSDIEKYVKWMKHGEWMKFDAPWESVWQPVTEEELGKSFTERFLYDLPLPRKRAVISTKEQKPLGWVNRYGEKKYPDAWYIGIDICEDDYLNKGYGTETISLWIEYLFSSSGVHRIGFDTYSFNPRMIRVGEKLGFVHEGTDREVVHWKGEWLDRLHFGMLRKEWEERGKE